jgi:hypothetical protein
VIEKADRKISVGAYAVQMARQGKEPVMSEKVIVLASRAAGKTVQTSGMILTSFAYPKADSKHRCSKLDPMGK